MELELATIEEIAAELQRRSTFRGILAWQKEHKDRPNDKWAWVANNCSPAEIAKELGTVLPS